MSQLIYQLTLAAGLNTPKKIHDYFEISARTWNRKIEKGHLKKCEYQALQHKAGYLLHGEFRGYKIVKNKLFSPQNNFANPREIANMTAIRELLSTFFKEIDGLKAEISTLHPNFQADLFKKYEILNPEFEKIRLKNLFMEAI